MRRSLFAFILILILIILALGLVFTGRGQPRARAGTKTLQVFSQSGRHSAHAPRPRPSKTPTLDQMGIDFTAQARQSKVAPVIGRDKYLERVIQVLCRGQQPRTEIRKNNVAVISDWISEPEPGTSSGIGRCQ